MMNKLAVSLVEFEISKGTKGDSALVQIDEQDSNIWFWMNPFPYPVPLEEFIKLTESSRNKSPRFVANFDLEKLFKLSYETPIFLDSNMDVDGCVMRYGDRFHNYCGSYYEFQRLSSVKDVKCICVKQRDDTRVLLHELLHLCSDFPLEFKSSYSDEERSIDIAAEVIIRNDLDTLLAGITKESIRGIFDFFNLDSSSPKLPKYLHEICIYPDNFSLLESDIINYYFLNELKQYVDSVNSKNQP